MFKVRFLVLLLFAVNATAGHSTGNVSNDSYSRASRQLMRNVYNQLPNKTLYCEATFSGRVITDSNGFYSSKYTTRGKKMEWEHVVPAENFGRNLPSWRSGNSECVTRAGIPYKGRRCATKISQEYRYMQADMYNLYPSIGAVNALRRNYRYAVVTGDKLGDCDMIINSAKAYPSESVRGTVARIHLYFDSAYPNYTLSDSQRQLFNAWDKTYPVTRNECDRGDLIETIQGNENSIVKDLCEGLD